jgi:hypothetical protein
MEDKIRSTKNTFRLEFILLCEEERSTVEV